MKERILTNWTFSRGLYAVVGFGLVIKGFMSQNWTGVLIGGYFSLMGIFAFGCAGGHCYGGNCEVEPAKKGKELAEES